MFALATLLAVVLVALIVTRVATAVLALTGLSKESARFQARSALTRVGFTTREAEAVVSHPVRRRVVMLLMLVGSAGVVTVIATLMLSFVGVGGRETGLRVVLLLGGLVVLLALAQSAAFDRALSHLIERALRRWTDLHVRDYASLLHLGGEYQVNELFVGRDHWAAGRPLGELRVWEEGLRVLGVVRADGTYLGAPIPPPRCDRGTRWSCTDAPPSSRRSSDDPPAAPATRHTTRRWRGDTRRGLRRFPSRIAEGPRSRRGYAPRMNGTRRGA